VTAVSVLLPLSRSAHDPASLHRSDQAFLDAAWPRARVVVVDADGRFAVTAEGDGLRLRLLAAGDVAAEASRFFLGEHDGVPHFAVLAPAPAVDAVRWTGLREAGTALDDLGAGLATTAVALANWHSTHTHCPRCGTPTEPVQGGWARRCPADGSDHFPRTDPAVIMLIHDGADRCVLGRQPSWPEGRYSVLAGFVDAGESAEAAVAREVGEEVGLQVADVRYVASQPWPFPSSLMLGFTALADPPAALRLRDGELSDAGWFSREQIRQRDGVVLLPSSVSIAYRLLMDWVDRG